MIYRTFKAPTYKEAVLKAKIEMGSNVYIIGRKAIKEGGFLGMFAKNFTEITVAKKLIINAFYKLLVVKGSSRKSSKYL